MASDPCTLTRLRTPESPASSSRQASPYATADAPAQPYPSRCMPSRPSAPNSLGQLPGRGRARLEPLTDVRTDMVVNDAAHQVTDVALVSD